VAYLQLEVGNCLDTYLQHVTASRKRPRPLHGQIIDTDSKLGIRQRTRAGSFLPSRFRLGATCLCPLPVNQCQAKLEVAGSF
jgi:hypothetical protein